MEHYRCEGLGRKRSGEMWRGFIRVFRGLSTVWAICFRDSWRFPNGVLAADSILLILLSLTISCFNPTRQMPNIENKNKDSSLSHRPPLHIHPSKYVDEPHSALSHWCANFVEWESECINFAMRPYGLDERMRNGWIDGLFCHRFFI